jgi:hypothetical protein
MVVEAQYQLLNPQMAALPQVQATQLKGPRVGEAA